MEHISQVLGKMKELHKGGNYSSLREQCERELERRGYIYKSEFGWEKREILERFGLLEANGIPVEEAEISSGEYELVRSEVQDKFGNVKIKRDRIPKKEKRYKLTQNFLDYLVYKKEQREKPVGDDWVTQAIKIVEGK